MKSIPNRLAEILNRIGIQYVFGISGGPSLPYIEALEEKGISFITVANEASAGIMADVYARLTGIPGACHATYGPGATNLSTGVGCAYLDRSPILAFTTEQSDSMRNRTCQMNIYHQALFKPTTKWTTRLKKYNIVQDIQIALNHAMTGLPGPVHIGLPVDL